MGQVTMIPDLLRGFGDINATQSAMVTTAGTVDQAATIAAATSVFGPIGTEFLAAFAVAQANHSRSVAQLAAVHAATAATAQTAATSYDSTEAQSATSFLSEAVQGASSVLTSAAGAAGSAATTQLQKATPTAAPADSATPPESEQVDAHGDAGAVTEPPPAAAGAGVAGTGALGANAAGVGSAQSSSFPAASLSPRSAAAGSAVPAASVTPVADTEESTAAQVEIA
ncbi:type VII secretion target [Nocardia alni]|uniref:type VII secretion target n=1 Tax=Nocardia alni TaxID=2815723 RepID=UPI0020B45549|nr:type VII secretion target [Nocardia alni]